MYAYMFIHITKTLCKFKQCDKKEFLFIMLKTNRLNYLNHLNYVLTLQLMLLFLHA